jgi:hypothetical protein
MNRCRVSITDTNGIPHDVEVQAESLYEAVALAVAEFRTDKLTAEVGPMTEFVIAIHRPPVEPSSVQPGDPVGPRHARRSYGGDQAAARHEPYQ